MVNAHPCRAALRAPKKGESSLNACVFSNQRVFVNRKNQKDKRTINKYKNERESDI